MVVGVTERDPEPVLEPLQLPAPADAVDAEQTAFKSLVVHVRVDELPRVTLVGDADSETVGTGEHVGKSTAPFPHWLTPTTALALTQSTEFQHSIS